MSVELPPLPYAYDALEPHMSEETLRYHHEKHHQAYVDKLNQLIAGTPHADVDLDAIILTSEGTIYNNAAQIWNHTFFFEGLAAQSPAPSVALLNAIQVSFHSLDEFKAAFAKSAVDNFGSGWTWLIALHAGESELAIINTANADLPAIDEGSPLLAVDVWEHAYYIDYRNARDKYLAAFWHVVNWMVVDKRLSNHLRVSDADDTDYNWARVGRI